MARQRVLTLLALTTLMAIMVTITGYSSLLRAQYQPKFIFDANDLTTTESMKIDKPMGCGNDLGAALKLLVIVNSAVDHFEARRAIRKTWGRFAVERGAHLFFMLGSTIDQNVQDKVMLEEQENSDMLQGQFIDNYFNLTLKTISMMKWISDHCYKVKYVLKVDDDMFVNMQHFIDFSETRYFNKCIIGRYLINLLLLYLKCNITDLYNLILLFI